MAKVFILFANELDDLSTIPTSFERVYLFKFIKGAPDIKHIQTRLSSCLDSADPVHDRIIFNGPSYLCAMAGYIWFTNELRSNTNFFAYSIKDSRYVEHTEQITV